MPRRELVAICSASDCLVSLEGKRSDAIYCSDTCSKRVRRELERLAHPHPHRNTPQYKQMRDMWAEYDGYHWLPGGGRNGEEGEGGSWDAHLRRFRQEYATAYR